ncbi:MAG TPA: hypothetical protein RMH85_24130 [Polyangiaceae bacterium LLY-WYZ-15_(1-7)]|nr:hypothetical protein [Myxococcales bacterium]MAT29714.1 hypothetical protein [Sandaracinus sp.]HJK90500.1 hypothetical protein [Polyangiaceae bacterium LLY-WYZ-15_(1-7)]MBJ75345.1 hypothetical protein [Sandaracinus sp.]HJL05012.1 hypothetical protein [Polyangiaceae bacterium LLY-WYZ-15_(1-7)]
MDGSKGSLRSLAPGVHVCAAPQRFLGIELGARMSVLELEGGLFVCSPVPVEPARVREALGEAPRWVLAPNLFHHLHVGPWAEAAAEAWAAPGLPEKRPDVAFDGVLEEVGEPFGEELLVVPLRCIPLTNEVVLLHRPSRTLITTDLLFHIPPDAPWPTRAAMRCALAYPGPRASIVERLGMKRERAREELAFLLAQDFDRVVLAHGEVIESGGRKALAGAYRWLWPRGSAPRLEAGG